MPNIVPFAFEGKPVRILDQDGEPWCVAKDVASILGYTNSRKAIRDHCKAYRPVGGTNRSSPSLDAQTLLIPERRNLGLPETPEMTRGPAQPDLFESKNPDDREGGA